MKYTLIGSGSTYSPIETVLKNRGVTEDLFNLDESVVEDYNSLDNIIEGVELLLKHIKNKSKIVLVVDCDLDGYTSSAILYRYIREEFGIEIEYKVHNSKTHGLSYDIDIEDDTNLVILPDSSSNDYAQHLELRNKGIDVIVLDHHETSEGYSENAIVINNQLSDKIKNKQLSGVGIVYKFLKAMDDYNYTDKADYYLDLVALGNVGDMMLLTSEETRYLVFEGLKNTNNTFLQALSEEYSFDLDGKHNITSLSWVYTPKVNACVRSGTLKEKQDMFEAFISDDYDFCSKVAKQLKNIKGRQDRAVKSSMLKMEKSIEFNKNDKVLIMSSAGANKSFTGLVANKLADKYGVPVIMYSGEKDGVLSGSGRGNPNITDTFKSDMSDTGLFVYTEGHEGAMGVAFHKDNLPKIKKMLNERYKDKEVISGKEYQVDFVLEHEEIIDDFVNELAQYEDEWGNGISAPLIVFRDIPIYIEGDNLKGLNIIFKVNGVKFIKKYATNVLKESLLYRNITVDIVGKCCINSYDGNGMVEIVDLTINKKVDL